MKILSMVILIIISYCPISYALDQYVWDANEKVEAIDKSKPCDYYRWEPKQKNNSYVTKATLYDKFKNEFEIEGEILDFKGCIDVDGDGVPEAVVTDYHSAVAGVSSFNFIPQPGFSFIPHFFRAKL